MAIIYELTIPHPLDETFVENFSFYIINVIILSTGVNAESIHTTHYYKLLGLNIFTCILSKYL